MQHGLILESLKPLLPNSASAAILDAGCGDGWLAGTFWRLPATMGFDISQELIEIAKKNHPSIKFTAADAAGKLPTRQIP